MQTIDLNEKQESLGIGQSYAPQTDEYKELVNYANLKLATLGLPPVGDQSENPALSRAAPELSCLEGLYPNRVFNDNPLDRGCGAQNLPLGGCAKNILIRCWG